MRRSRLYRRITSPYSALSDSCRHGAAECRIQIKQLAAMQRIVALELRHAVLECVAAKHVQHAGKLGIGELLAVAGEQIILVDDRDEIERELLRRWLHAKPK